MGQPGNKIKIDLPEKEAIAGLFKVKPTTEMPKRKGAARPVLDKPGGKKSKHKAQRPAHGSRNLSRKAAPFREK